MNNLIKIVKNDIKNVDLTELSLYFPGGHIEKHFWEKPAGWCEYKLYSYLSEKINNKTILDIGTRYGGSALAFSKNSTNSVISYDIVRWESHDYLKKDNIDLRIGNFMEDETIDYKNVDIIMIDVDPHDGIQEPPMIDFLVNEKQWSGLLLLDDISEELWKPIYDMWSKLPYEKYDLTDVGHFSGTGLLNIGNKFKVEVC